MIRFHLHFWIKLNLCWMWQKCGQITLCVALLFFSPPIAQIEEKCIHVGNGFCRYSNRHVILPSIHYMMLYTLFCGSRVLMIHNCCLLCTFATKINLFSDFLGSIPYLWDLRFDGNQFSHWVKIPFSLTFLNFLNFCFRLDFCTFGFQWIIESNWNMDQIEFWSQIEHLD